MVWSEGQEEALVDPPVVYPMSVSVVDEGNGRRCANETVTVFSEFEGLGLVGEYEGEDITPSRAVLTQTDNDGDAAFWLRIEALSVDPVTGEPEEVSLWFSTGDVLVAVGVLFDAETS